MQQTSFEFRPNCQAREVQKRARDFSKDCNNMTAFSSLSDDSVAGTIVPTVVAITSGVVAYLVLSSIYRKKTGKGRPGGPINQKIDKDKAKVVHCFDIEDLPNNVSYCRCWKSKKVRVLFYTSNAV